MYFIPACPHGGKLIEVKGAIFGVGEGGERQGVFAHALAERFLIGGERDHMSTIGLLRKQGLDERLPRGCQERDKDERPNVAARQTLDETGLLGQGIQQEVGGFGGHSPLPFLASLQESMFIHKE